MGSERPDLEGLRIDEQARGGRHGGRRLRWVAAAAALLIITVVAGLLLASRPIEVETAPVKAISGRGRTTILNASGYVTPRRRATVAAKITGRVTEMLVEEGMRVKAGQVLARLDDADARRRLEASRADLEVARASVTDLEVRLADAERTMGRMMELRRRKVVSQAELDQAVTAVDSLRAQLVVARDRVRAAAAQVDVSQQDVENCTVRAPFAGIAVSKDAQVGEMVSPISAGGGFTRTGISTIVDMASLEIEVDVNEAYIARVKAGQPVEATLDAYPDWHMPAHVRTVIPTADRQKATVKVRISFDQLDPRILPDMGVKVAFLAVPEAGGEAAAPRLLVPTAALRREGGRRVVFVVKSGRLERRAVQTGDAVGDDTEVLAGLQEGDMVVVAARSDLRDGQRVNVRRER
jgi:RND family efflux transporter MFP subunit